MGKPVDAKRMRADWDTSENQAKFKLAMLQNNLHLGAELEAALARVLQENGYKTATVSVRLDKLGDIALDSLRDIDADAVLFAVVIGAGYSDSPVGGPFAPDVKTRVQLIDVKSKKILLEQWYLYDAYASPQPQTIRTPEGGKVEVTRKDAAVLPMTILRPPTAYRFDSFEQLLANPSLAAEGLRAAVPMMSGEIGEILRSR